MKIRSGFVSNSSSSSFTCDVCGEEQSGMDMSVSDAGMERCRRGHTYCESHRTGTEPTLEQMRNDLIALKQKHTWKKPEEIEADIVKINAMEEQEVRDTHEEYDREKSFGYNCPICNFVNVDYSDVVKYYYVKNGLDCKSMAAKFKEEFGTYDNLKSFLYPKKA